MDSLGSASVHYICGNLTKHSKFGVVALLKDKLIRVHMTCHFREHTQLATARFLSTKVAITVLPRAFQLLPMAFPELQSKALN